MKFLLAASAVLCVTLTNSEGFITCNPSEIIQANSTSHIVAIVKDAIQRSKSVKAFGARHSTNKIICSKENGIAVDMKYMDSIVSVDVSKKQVTVQGGAPLVKFMKELIPHGLSVEGAVDYGAITVAGAIATGAHSSSLRVKGGVADSIVDVTLVSGTGEIIKISNGDKDFAAVHTNLGALGIITEVTYQAVDLFKVKTSQIDVSDQIETLPENIVTLVKQHDYANLYWFSENNKAIIHAYDKVSAYSKGKGYRKTWDPAPLSLIPNVYYKVIRLLNNHGSESQMCLLSKYRASRLSKPETTESIGYFGDMYMGRICEGPKCLFPQVDDVEIAIPLERVSEALKDVVKISKAYHLCLPVFGLYVRFGTKSNTLLGPTRNGDVAYIEMHILRNTKEAPHLGFSAVDEIRQLLLTKYHGQPHYGKNFAVDFMKLPRNSNIDAFKTISRKYDPHGLFLNDFLDFSPPKSQSKQCAFDRTCVCSSDSDCYDGHVCTQGKIFKSAKICLKGIKTKCHRGDECASGKCKWDKCL